MTIYAFILLMTFMEALAIFILCIWLGTQPKLALAGGALGALIYLLSVIEIIKRLHGAKTQKEQNK